MNINIDHYAIVQYLTDIEGREDIARQIVFDLGRPGMHFVVEMRDLIYWVAYRLDTGDEGRIINHRTAVLLRGIADTFFPFMEDEADAIIDDLLDQGVGVKTEIGRVAMPHFDVRLLGLSDGMVRITDTFEEVLWDDEDPHPVLSHNAKSVVDVLFPDKVFELTGIRGIGVHELDLICWLKEAADRSALAFEENQEVWLDELAGAERRDAAVAERYRAERARQRALKRSVSAAPEVRTPADPDAVLEELSALFYDAAA